jgi:hypothetical protein
MRRFSVVGIFSAIALAAACSLVNAPADVMPGTGGGHAGSGAGTGGNGHCVVDKDCPASDVPCARYACVLGGVCQLVTLSNGEACDDGHWCTINDACDDGKCVGEPRACPGQDACNVGSCDETKKACAVVFADAGTPCDDGDPCTEDGTCNNGKCQKGPDACAKLATDCTDSVCGATGCVTTNKQDGIFCGQSACSNGQCVGGHCNIQAVNEGMPCDDTLFCTVNDTCRKGHCVGDARVCPTIGQCIKGTCDEASKQCLDTPIPDLGPCDDGNACTAGEFCTNNVCGGGLPPATYFTETFANGGASGWTKGPEWQIGHAMASFGGQDGDDPGFDKTGEGWVAGVEIGGLANVDPIDPTHPLYYLTSPPFDDDKAGSMYLTFYRWLNTDYQPYMRDTVEVSNDNGETWHVVWENPFDIPINDAQWTFQAVDISAYKGKASRVRFGFAIGSVGVYSEASWNIDLVKIQNAPCNK